MTAGGLRPYLLLDVDGVLNPSLSPGSWRKRAGTEGWRKLKAAVEFDGKLQMLTVTLNAAWGPQLLELAAETGAELAWATAWEGRANTWIAPALGLPELPWAPIGSRYSSVKPGKVIQWAAGRPFVWLDDDPAVITTANAVPGCRGILVNRYTGLSAGDLSQAHAALRVLRGGGDSAPAHGPDQLLGARYDTPDQTGEVIDFDPLDGGSTG